MSTKTNEALDQRVIELICRLHDVPKEQITLDSNFTADLGFDSLEKVEFVMEVEEEFNISVSDQEGDTIQTVGDAVEAIRKLVA
jgi:acyl carrier protein